jgi:hypothetical protein
MKKKTVMPGPRPAATGPLIIVDLHDRVPGMSDEALGTLHVNALRLVQSGNERQRTSAGALMPVIESELALREAKALANKPVRKPRAPAKKRVIMPAAIVPVSVMPAPVAPTGEEIP